MWISPKVISWGKSEKKKVWNNFFVCFCSRSCWCLGLYGKQSEPTKTSFSREEKAAALVASPPCLSAPLTPFLTQNLPPIGFFIRWDIIVGTKGFACMFKLWRRKAVSRSWWCPPACPPRRRSQTGPGSSQTCCLRCRSTEKKKNCYSKKLNFHSESFGELMTNENIPGLWDPIRNDWLRGREDCQYCSNCSGKEAPGLRKWQTGSASNWQTKKCLGALLPGSTIFLGLEEIMV